MNDYQAQFQQIIDEELGNYAQQALALLANAIQARGLVLTQDLLQSLRSEVVKTSVSQVASMGVAFEQYGRIREMKQLSRSKAPPIAVLEDYVRKVGLQNFQYIPGYTDRSKVAPTSAVAINRIAWGMARAKLRDQGQARPKSWFSKTFYGSLNRFIDAVTGRYLTTTGQHLATTLRNG